MRSFTIVPENENENRRVQKKLFEGGFIWKNHGDKIFPISKYSITTHMNKTLNNDSTCSTPLKAIEYANEHGFVVITAQEFFRNPEIVDGWEKTTTEKMVTIDGKEYSESTIKKAIQEYCN